MEIPQQLRDKVSLCLLPLIVEEVKQNNALEDVYWYIINYCAILEVPENLYGVWANMAVDLLRYESILATEFNPEQEVSEGSITSISEGDTSISYGTISKETSVENTIDSHKANLDAVVLNYTAQLNSFRRFRW